MIKWSGNANLLLIKKLALKQELEAINETNFSKRNFIAITGTHPPPLILPFLLKQNLSPKDIARSDIKKLKVS